VHSTAPGREADGFRDLRERNPRSRIPFCAGHVVWMQAKLSATLLSSQRAGAAREGCVS
jgi:hypothetical protein